MPLLSWLNKDEAVTAARRCDYRLLEEVPELSYGDKDNENLLIQGDNLEALKALIPFYAGKVKCIFIDPPYNTKSAFEHYDDNLEHSQWLSLMYPRLELLRELLSEDGSIWVTIDDREAHYLKVIMDEVFGRRNFISNAVWQKKYTIANDAKWLSDNHDHVLIYSLNKDKWRPFPLPRSEEMNQRYKNPDGHPKGVWKATPLYAKRSGSEKEQAFKFTFKNGYVWQPPIGASPRFPEDKLREMDQNDEIWFGANGDASPSRKTFLCELKSKGTPAATLWLHSEVGHNHEAKDEIKELITQSTFDTPKPERLIKRILELATQEGDLVLDSFLGSGTTAAVAHKMGRRYISVEIGDHAKTHCQPRLKRWLMVSRGVSKAVDWQGGGGFKFVQLGHSVFDEYGSLNTDIKFPTLAAHIWYLETKEPSADKKDSAFLGLHDEVAYYLLYNGILGDRRPQGGNVLTSKVLDGLPEIETHLAKQRKVVIYGESTRLGETRLHQSNILFKQIPYDVGAL